MGWAGHRAPRPLPVAPSQQHTSSPGSSLPAESTHLPFRSTTLDSPHQRPLCLSGQFLPMLEPVYKAFLALELPRCLPLCPCAPGTSLYPTYRARASPADYVGLLTPTPVLHGHPACEHTHSEVSKWAPSQEHCILGASQMENT